MGVKYFTFGGFRNVIRGTRRDLLWRVTTSHSQPLRLQTRTLLTAGFPDLLVFRYANGSVDLEVSGGVAGSPTHRAGVFASGNRWRASASRDDRPAGQPDP